VPSLAKAHASVDQVLMDPRDRARLDVHIYETGLGVVRQKGEAPGLRIGDHQATSRGMREALEKSLRQLARLTSRREDRVELVDKANSVRPWTLR